MSKWLDVHRRVVKKIRETYPEISGGSSGLPSAAALNADGKTGDLEILVVHFGTGKTLSGRDTLALRTSKHQFMNHQRAMTRPVAEIELMLRLEVAKLVETSDYHKAGCPALVWLNDDGDVGTESRVPAKID